MDRPERSHEKALFCIFARSSYAAGPIVVGSIFGVSYHSWCSRRVTNRYKLVRNLETPCLAGGFKSSAMDLRTTVGASGRGVSDCWSSPCRAEGTDAVRWETSRGSKVRDRSLAFCDGKFRSSFELWCLRFEVARIETCVHSTL